MKTRYLSIVAFSLVLFTSPPVNGQKLKAEEIISKHLASIGSADKLSKIKSFVAVGDVTHENITRKDKPGTGRMVITSEGDKMFLGMRLSSTDYPQEIFIFDGTKTNVALVREGTRSPLGNFLHLNNALMSQGIFSGPLKTSWALLKAGQSGAKITAAGTKKIDGKEVYALTFNPKGGNDLDITMYFDQQTFQHVRTEYKRTISAAIGQTVDQSARQFETRMKVTEDFSEYKEHEGMTIPTKYKIHYSITGTSGTIERQWTTNFTEFAVDMPLEPGTFAIDK